MNDEISIRIPPTTTHVALVRALASGLGARLDLSYDRITDLHIAVDELCSRLLATSQDPEALEAVFSLGDGSLTMRIRAVGPTRPDRPFLNPWSRKILEAVLDDFRIVEEDGRTEVEAMVARTP